MHIRNISINWLGLNDIQKNMTLQLFGQILWMRYESQFYWEFLQFILSEKKKFWKHYKDGIFAWVCTKKHFTLRLESLWFVGQEIFAAS